MPHVSYNISICKGISIVLKTISKCRELEGNLIRLIISDGIKKGEAILSENKLSLLFGVSRVTVRQAIANLEERGILRSEHGRGTFVVSPPVISLGEGQGSKLIGLTFSGGADNPFMASIAFGAQSIADDFNLCIGVVVDANNEAEMIRQLLKRGVDGLIISPVESNPVSPFLFKIASSGVKLVLIDAQIRDFNMPSVSSDDREGGFLATQRLCVAGHRRIAHIRGPELIANAIERFDGYRLALERNGIVFNPELVPASDPHFGYAEKAGQTAMRTLLELPENKCPTAIFAANDNLALGAWSVMKEYGLSVPGHISLVGYGNLRTPYERGLFLTSVDQSPQDIGYTALKLLIRLIGGDKIACSSQILLRPKLVDRESVKDFKGL